MRYFFIIFSILLFGGCSLYVSKPELKKSISKPSEIYDLTTIPQDATYFSKFIENNNSFYEIQQKYSSKYFSVWNMDKPRESIESIIWPFIVFTPKRSYGENLQPLEQGFFDEMIESASFEDYATLNKKGLTLREVDLRAFPTIRPLLKDPSLAGEGFPFDYLQNSTVHANSPIFISHYSKNRDWAYIFSSFASGWIKANEFVILEEDDRDFWQNAEQIYIIKEGVAIYDAERDFLYKSKIGMSFAVVSEDEISYKVLTVASHIGTRAIYSTSIISKEIATKEVMRLNVNNLPNIVKEVSKTNYGWGGMYEQRDCSSMLRDMFAPFGIWLPRNSYQQSRVGRVISLKDMNEDEKIRVIKEKAVPFQTLLYKKGHIVLYVGTYNENIVVFHNTWGIKTKKDGVEGRLVIGRAIFSTLKLGEELQSYDNDSELLKNIISMNIITE
ncbi:NLP/P60 [Sulfurimonas denitrificans DSM 1251]|uniref:NLP/P60 n=1 Tax=Sulfurimonas denitrificans (strain ATCC 33889 / DSM 1251) TaxID=326298 RepID=Q30RK8_SULDN|nr:NlpC/P60 family N-terminal domain-containing protein [Sulfurimonas denitrificans]ABB44373.1 NLP/P60 [Sulfurimonas denitrificans DSM 1251]MDD3441931.1 NlpC/P60 family N-terminal domain-containing protein [Sulfurimonas denitrificans]